MLFFFVSEGDAVGDEFEFVFKVLSAFAETGEFDGLEFLREEELVVED